MHSFNINLYCNSCKLKIETLLYLPILAFVLLKKKKIKDKKGKKNNFKQKY